MNIGELKHRISLIQKTETISENGFKERVWSEVSKAWAMVKYQKRARVIEQDKESVDNAYLFIIRYREVEKDMRIRYQNKDFEILTIQDETFERRFLTLTAKEVM